MGFRSLVDALKPRSAFGPTRRRQTPQRLRLEPLEERYVLSAYLQTNLAADQPGAALVHDPELVNAWGIALNPAPTGAFWISCEGTGLSTLYTGDVTQAGGSLSPFVKGTLTVTLPGGAPTGQVFSGSATDFIVSAVDGAGNIDSAPSRFITVSGTGHLTGWAASVPSPPAPSRNAQLVGTTPGAVYTGLAIASNGEGNFLYAADFGNGEIDVFDRAFAPTTLAGQFVDPDISDDYAPFNIQSLGGKLYVTYAQQQGADPLPDKAHGFVSVFDTNGNFLSRLISHDHLKAPWGLALAPAGFGDLSNALLVANHGDGRINAYDPTTGAYIDRLRGADGEPIKIDGLLGLHFGNGRSAGDLNALYFTAGPDGGAHGLLGSLRLITVAAGPDGGSDLSLRTDEGAPPPLRMASVEVLAGPGVMLGDPLRLTQSNGNGTVTVAQGAAPLPSGYLPPADAFRLVGPGLEAAADDEESLTGLKRLYALEAGLADEVFAGLAADLVRA